MDRESIVSSSTNISNVDYNTTNLIISIIAPTVLASNTTLRHISVTSQTVITLIYLLGLVGNSMALYFLYGTKTAPKNPKHAVMLRCLVINDLVAVSGMWVQMTIHLYWIGISSMKFFCVIRVLWRVFGLGSGSVVIVMAIERWLALTRPFFYQKYITTSTIRKGILTLWMIVLVLVCLPFFGFGLYYKSDKGCLKYKLAKTSVDRAYAYLYFFFGSFLCACLICCNIAVMNVLMKTRAKAKRKMFLVRRISKNKDLSGAVCTTEEIAFARLMGFLCIVFVLCWLPQLISIPLAQYYPESRASRTFLRFADILIAMHFTLDPYLYVLQRRPLFKSLWNCITSKYYNRRSSSRRGSTRTQQELVSL